MSGKTVQLVSRNFKRGESLEVDALELQDKHLKKIIKERIINEN